MLVSLYTSRVVLNVLGVDDFGTYNVVGGMVTMFGFFNSAMISATQRFLTFDLGRKDLIQLHMTFNATLIIHFVIALFVFTLAETVGLWFLNSKLNLPEGRMEAAQWVYHFAVLSFMVSIIQVPYNSIIIARERMSVYAYMSILEVLLKLIIVFMLTWIAYDKLKLYSILLFSVSVIIASYYRIYCLKQFNETRFKLVKDKSLYKMLISYSGWNLFGNLAGVAKGQGVSIILNLFFGTVVNAAQGIANQVSAAVNMFVGNFQMASNLVIRTSKFSFYLLFILTLPIMLEVDYILKLWLKIVPDYTAIFTVLILINALIDSVSGPLMTALQATGRIKVYQSVVGILLVFILPISYLFFKLGFPPESTFFVSISIAIVAFIFRMLLTKRQIPEFSIRQFLQEIFFRNIPVILLSFLITGLIRINMHPGFTRFLIVALTSLSISMVTIYLLGLKSNERIFVRDAITAFVSKFKR
jgi:O-antigen/teichoic acid export membrane protein